MDWRFSFIGFLSAGLICFIWKYRAVISRVWFRCIVKPELPISVKATKEDRQIVLRAREHLSSEGLWDKNYQGHCILGEKVSLYCALALAAKELSGTYDLHAAYRQSILSAILQNYPSRYKYNPDPKHLGNDPLLNFNNHPSTRHAEILSLLDEIVCQIK